MSGDDIIVSQNIRIGCTLVKARVSFSDLSTLGPGFKNSGFTLLKRRINLDKTPIRRTIFWNK